VINLTLIKPAISSVALHVIAFGMLLVSLDLTPKPRQPFANNTEIIDAVTIDSARVEEELNAIKEAEQQRQREELKKQQDLEKQLAEMRRQSEQAEQKRFQEEQRLANIKKQQQQEEVKRKAEAEKLAAIKKQQQVEEARRKEEEQKLADAKKQQEELKKRQEEEAARQKAEAERKRQEELRLAEETRKKQEAKRLAAEKARQQAEQDRQDMSVINSYVARIANAIESEFNTAGLPPGLSCVFQIRMIPGGEVAEARVVKSSGNAVFDSRAEIALQRASPLPVPDNPRIFGKMREIRLTFAPN
jgi:colicin import membrane protein